MGEEELDFQHVYTTYRVFSKNPTQWLHFCFAVRYLHESRLPNSPGSATLGKILMPSKPPHPCQENEQMTTQITARLTRNKVYKVLHTAPGI